jgi:hypothetical protein
LTVHQLVANVRPNRDVSDMRFHKNKCLSHAKPQRTQSESKISG